MKTRLTFLYFISAFLLFLIVVLAMFNEKKVEEIEKKEGEEINFESDTTIQLFKTQEAKIQEINLNYYLLCVVASEIPFKYEYEAIKAQVIVARTYLFNKIINNTEEKGDICDSYAHCQAFSDIDKLEEIWRNKGFSNSEISEGEDKIRRAILDTDNQIITYNGEIINAFFHASSPGKTEDAKAIWGCQDIPYLKSVESQEDEDYENRTSVVQITYETFKNTLIDNGYIEDLSKEDFNNIYINEYTESGRVKDIKVGPYKIKAENLRSLFGIKSTNFKICIADNSIEFDVVGYGHGVGLSQVGANTYAKSGKTYDEIIHHYYTDVDIVDGYSIQAKRGEI